MPRAFQTPLPRRKSFSGSSSRRGAIDIMRVMGLDIGERRIGVAVADSKTGISHPLKVMDRNDVMNGSAAWRTVLEDNEPQLLVAGLPKTLQGKRGMQAGRIEKDAFQISSACGVPVEFVDERLSSAEAKRYLREQGMNDREMRGKIDSVAASLILETWLQRQDENKGDG